MAMVVMSTHGKHPKDIHTKANWADKKQLTGVHFWRFKASVIVKTHPLRDNPLTYRRCIASKQIKTEIRIRNIPFENPESVSMRPYL